MLELRPNCESCDKDLPASSRDAKICSYECTFCADCVENVLFDVCPNCGGGFSSRPIRPLVSRRAGVGLEYHPASVKRIHTKYSSEEIKEFSEKIKDIPLELR
ncbi:MAG: DUF1272 domain-containing protein [Cellvibrionaceae bacterium]